MIEYIALVLLGYIAYQDYYNRKERQRLIDAFLAKNLTELKEVKPVAEAKNPGMPPIGDIPLDQATPEEFDKAIRATVDRDTKKTIVDKTVDKLFNSIGRVE